MPTKIRKAVSPTNVLPLSFEVVSVLEEPFIFWEIKTVDWIHAKPLETNYCYLDIKRALGLKPGEKIIGMLSSDFEAILTRSGLGYVMTSESIQIYSPDKKGNLFATKRKQIFLRIITG